LDIQIFTNEIKRLTNFIPTKNILLWPNSYGYRFGTGRQTFVDSGCRVSNCLITYNSTLMPHSQFDAFLVHPPTSNGSYVLKDHRPDQISVMFSTEPPVHMKNMENFENYFNWTISYWTGSTFQLKYGEIIPLESAPQTEEELATLRLSAAQSAVNPAKGKTKLAIWMVTNCKARSNRQGYVRALRKHLTNKKNQTSSLLDIFSRDGCEGGLKRKERSGMLRQH
jgi:alpha-1,3-fucosyltransferase